MQTTELALQEPTSPAAATSGRTAMDRIEERQDWPLLSRLPMRLTAGIPLARFKVRDLLALKQGQLLSSAWTSTDDVPLRIGSVQLSWSEFEVVEQRMAVRLTRLA
jgi:flagellar motor switch protein FliN/FliY